MSKQIQSFPSPLPVLNGGTGVTTIDDLIAALGITGANGEVALTPKEAADGTAEGTMFYCSTDNAVYVGTE
jgi:uncharacterized protein GlcG (DUF336 family)